MTTVMKASDSAEFLAMIPALAGFTPSRSVVLVPFERGRAYGALRIDLPDDDTDLDAFTDDAIAFLARVDRVDAAALVVYTDDEATPTREGLVLPADALAMRVSAAIGDAGLRLLDALCVMPQGWASYLDDDPVLEPLPEPIPAGDEIAGDQSHGAELPAVDLVQKERVGRALLALDEAIERQGAPARSGRRLDPRAIETAQLLENVPLFAEAMLRTPCESDPFRIAALLRLLERPLYRDVVLTQWMSDQHAGERMLDAQLTGRSGDAPPAAAQAAATAASTSMPPVVQSMRFVGIGPRPDLDRVRRALEVARALAAHAPRRSRPGPLAVAAWMSWALGRASHSAQYLAAIESIEPGYRLGRLLTALFQECPLPDWAFESRADLAA